MFGFLTYIAMFCVPSVLWLAVPRMAIYLCPAIRPAVQPVVKAQVEVVHKLRQAELDAMRKVREAEAAASRQDFRFYSFYPQSATPLLTLTTY